MSSWTLGNLTQVDLDIRFLTLDAAVDNTFPLKIGLVVTSEDSLRVFRVVENLMIDISMTSNQTSSADEDCEIWLKGLEQVSMWTICGDYFVRTQVIINLF